MSSHILLATVFIVALTTGTASAGPPSINPCDPAWQKAEYTPAAVTDWPGRQDLAHFEARLKNGQALWIGNATIPSVARKDRDLKPTTDHRAIVKVDIHPAKGMSQCFDDPHAWYLAAIPMKSDDACTAVNDYYRVEPIFPHVLGYCYLASQVVVGCPAAPSRAAQSVPANVMLTNPKNVCSGYAFQPGTRAAYKGPLYEVVTYDPKCVCKSVDGVIDITSQ